jgi:GNAT superfamily N-acetyltransferase
MIGVRAGFKGSGLGRRLLERVHHHSPEVAGSEGVSLHTEDPGNVPLYEHFGYEVTGRGRVAPELETWTLFRPDPHPS